MIDKINVDDVTKGVTQKAKLGFGQMFFSRTLIMTVLMILQIAIFYSFITYLSKYDWQLYVFMTWISAFVVIRLVNAEGNPAIKLAWVVPILMFPIVGASFYLFCTMQQQPKKNKKKLKQLWLDISPFMQQNEEVYQELKKVNKGYSNLAYFLSNSLSYPVYSNTQITYFPSGEDKFEMLLTELNKAQKFIFMEYFIVEESYMWDNILQILEEKVKQGVEVRFMYDGMCGIELMPYHYPKTLMAKGIRCKVFNPVLPILSTHQNNRDHRKICVIDGEIGFTGGINLGDEYINRKERFGHWKDTAIMLDGDAVGSLTMMFLQMWNLTEDSREVYHKYLTKKTAQVDHELGYVLPFGDSPYDDENVGEQVYFHILNHATKYVHIMTPYLILDNEMITNLTYTAKCGIEVIIIMPHIPDKWYAFALAKTYYQQLIEAGVQIYEYSPGFVHAKMFISDDESAAIGTINLDYRSLYLNFECGAFIYKNPEIIAMEEDFQATLQRCQKVSVEDVRNRGFVTKAVGNILRMIAPLM